MPHRNRLNPQSGTHTGARSVLRIAGPVVAVIALGLVGSGAYEIVAGDPFENPGSMFVRMFVGMPLLFAGLVMTQFGYMGAVLRYGANEAAPVGRDTFNYVVDGTRDSMRDAASAIAGGLREGLLDEADGKRTQTCAACGHHNDADARFCDDCGKPLALETRCDRCGTANDADARYCDRCGGPLGAT